MARKILLAGDSPTIQKVFELSLAKSDVALTMIDNGEDAVRLAAETAPDLIVADVSLPGKDGFEVATELRRSEKTKESPILILSGTLAPFDEDRFKESGASGVLFKPFESQELVNKLEELLQSREETPPAGKEEVAATAAEPWDFSDVLEEVEAEASGQLIPSAAPLAEELLAGVMGAPEKGKPAASLDEFDISLEDLDEPSKAQEPPPVPVEPTIPEEPPMVTVAHMDESPLLDAPPPVTDLSPALEEVQEIEEVEELEEVEMLGEAAAQAAPAESAPGPPPPAPPAADAGAPAPVLPDALRDQFSARSKEIYEKVVAETVEKVMWEWMDRLSQEFSAKIRESVEAVAWEVIPATAETLIREEIARIRAQFEKKSPPSR